MILVPDSADAVLSSPSPLLGGVEEATELAAFCLKLAEASADYGKRAGHAKAELARGEGGVLTRLVARLDERVLPGGRIVNESALDARRGFISFASSIASLETRAGAARQRVGEALAVVRASAQQVCDICREIGAAEPEYWRSVPSGALPTVTLGAQAALLDESARESYRQLQAYQHEGAWLRATVAWQRALEDIDQAVTLWSNLVEDREKLEQKLMVVMRETDLGCIVGSGSSGQLTLEQTIAFGVAGELRGAKFVDLRAPNRAVDALLARGLTGKSLAEAWQQLELTDAALAALPMATLARVAAANGLPARAQDIAARQLLHFAIVSPRAARALLSLDRGDMSVESFHGEMLSLYGAWAEAKREAQRLRGKPAVQLLALGNHDGALTAAISHGDLDTAKYVNVDVSGMGSAVEGIANDAKAGRNLYAAIDRAAGGSSASGGTAVVTWIGYRSPGFTTVNSLAHAQAGAPELSAFVDGIIEQRATGDNSSVRFTVFAHSYGSTTAALALSQTLNTVDSFVAYGSAGLANGTTVNNINANKVFATQASGDQTAKWGQLTTHQVVPTELDGVHCFSAEEAPGLKRVTAHAKVTESGAVSVANPGGLVGYATRGTRFLETAATISVNGEINETQDGCQRN